MGQLDGKTALVTGGTSGIGLATAQRMAAEGAHVFLTGRTQQTIDDAVASIGDAATGVRSDITEQADLDTLAGAISARGRGLDILFANAGGGEFATLQDETPEHLADTFNRNVGGTVFTVQTVLPLLNAGASIVLAGSTAASGGTPAFGAYAASKAAIRSIRAHLGGGARGPPDQGEHRGPRARRDARTQGAGAQWSATGPARRTGRDGAAGPARPPRRDRRRGCFPRL